MQAVKKTKAEKTAMVGSLELAAIKAMRADLEDMRLGMENLLCDLRKAENEAIERIEAGATVDGKAVVITRRRQNISWQTVLRHELGEQAVVRAKDSWPIAFYKELQIG